MNNPSPVKPVVDSLELPVTKPAATQSVKPKPTAAQVKPKPAVKRPIPIKRPSPDELDWLEQGFGQRRSGDDAAKKAKEKAEAKKRQEDLDRLAALDKRQSKQMYEEIQSQIKKLEQIREQEKQAGTAKYITGQAGYNPEQHQDPDSFWDKVKKKQEEAKKKLPWTSKQGMGTGEITRGVSG